jgi:hypothetical protein
MSHLFHLKNFKTSNFQIFLVLTLFNTNIVTFAGPPFQTDDPEPVEYKHWEYYISSINSLQHNSFSGTLPHFEVNYGLIRNVQVHLLLPLNYTLMQHQNMHYGYGYTELGMKYRFIQETDHSPQVGVFPILEIPTVPANEFNNGRVQLYLPIWVQKSWDKLTTYGGGGFWINPGTGNTNWYFAGWEAQYDFLKAFTLGCELYYHSSMTVDSKSSMGFNLGGLVNSSEKAHFIFSVGHTFINESSINAYAGLLITI